MTAGDCKELWQCMLELQEAYNCYHSTRIDLALDAGDAAVNLMRESRISLEKIEQARRGLTIFALQLTGSSSTPSTSPSSTSSPKRAGPSSTAVYVRAPRPAARFTKEIVSSLYRFPLSFAVFLQHGVG